LTADESIPFKGTIPPFTATLGMCDDGAPLLVRLSSPDVGHVLIAGADGCGKTSLLQTIAVSLAVTNRPRDLGLVLVGRELGDLERLPHVLRCEVGSLSRLIGRQEIAPRVVVLIDDLADIKPLAQLLERGHAAGVYIVASGNVSSAGFSTLINGKGEPGDFEVMASGQTIRFQAATITPAEVNQVVMRVVPKSQPTRLYQTAALSAGANQRMVCHD